MQSMTGFGSAHKGAFRVDVRSLNNRHSEIHFKIPSGFAALEMPMRERIKVCFVRGKFDVTISAVKDGCAPIRLNDAALESIVSSLQTLRDRMGYKEEITLDTLLTFKELLFTSENGGAEEDVLHAFELALNSLEEMRKAEGMEIKQEMVKLLNALSYATDEIAAHAAELPARCKTKILKRMDQLGCLNICDEARLYQEIALIAQRADISEEIARLKSHIGQFIANMESDVAGRKLDFILQEMFREANTIAQKSEDINIINLTIQVKAEIERLKEQAQNIQ